MPHDAGCDAAHITRSITTVDRCRIMHTGWGKFDIINNHIERMGRTQIIPHDNTVLEHTGVKVKEDLALMRVSHLGSNQMDPFDGSLRVDGKW